MKTPQWVFDALKGNEFISIALDKIEKLEIKVDNALAICENVPRDAEPYILCDALDAAQERLEADL